MTTINYKSIYDENKKNWLELSTNPQKYEQLLAGHYSDSNHFIYELLQNAEDANADKVLIEYYEDKLVFYHNGDPFNEADVRGVASMLMGTKDKEDGSKIGRFGMGFKSVYKYTIQPEIYSDNETFRIINYLLPEEINAKWNYLEEKNKIFFKIKNEIIQYPFINSKHLTKFVISFVKRNKDGEKIKINGNDILIKLKELNAETILFLTNVKELFWTNKTNNENVYICLNKNKDDNNLIECNTYYGSFFEYKKDFSRFLKYRKTFNHKEMKNAEVSIAYKLNNRAFNINETDGSYIFVYFPTKDKTDLPFLIHGSFETAVSREKLMNPSTFNNDLLNELSELITYSIKNLANRKLLTQSFIRNILMRSFIDEETNKTIPGLKKKITELFKNESILPDSKNNYYKSNDIYVAVPFKLADFQEIQPFTEFFKEKIHFVHFNNSTEPYFNQYFEWLVNDVGIKKFDLSLWFGHCYRNVVENKKILIEENSDSFNNLKSFYKFLADEVLNNYSSGTKTTSQYNQEISGNERINKTLLSSIPIILNADKYLVPSKNLEDFNNDKILIYLNVSDEYRNIIPNSQIVNKTLANEFGDLFSNYFGIKPFDDFLFIKENIIPKYQKDINQIDFKSDFYKENIDDIKKIFICLKTSEKSTELSELLRKTSIIKTKSPIKKFALPQNCYLPKSKEGIDLKIYFSNFDDYYLIDKEYYECNGINDLILENLNVISTPVFEGNKSSDGTGDNYWIAIGQYCPNIKINLIQQNIVNIANQIYDNEISQKKSSEILKLLLYISSKLCGQRKIRRKNPYVSIFEKSDLLENCIKRYRWLYDDNNSLKKIEELSRYELSDMIYKDLPTDDKSYKLLGFIEKENDIKRNINKQIFKLDETSQREVLHTLADKFGVTIIDKTNKKNGDEWDYGWENEPVFNLNEDISDNSFPIKRVKNIEILRNHVVDMFYLANPVIYEKVWRQVRVSKNRQADRYYVMNMYCNESKVCICQMCRNATKNPEAIQIANFGFEMPQLNICLCPNCSAEYKKIRDTDKESFKKKIIDDISKIDLNIEEKIYKIPLEYGKELSFTQVHIAEIHEIIRLLQENGLQEKEIIINTKDNNEQQKNYDDNKDIVDLPIFYLRERGIIAKGKYLKNNKFIVLKGSQMRNFSSKSFNERANCRDIKKYLLSNNIVVDWIFQEDYTFNSPSAASTTILGTPSTGYGDWKDNNGNTLGSYIKK